MANLPKHNQHVKRSRLQERNAASRLGGSVNSGSGNQWRRKNDVRTATESVELKTTTKDSYTLKAEDIDKMVKNALLDGARLGWIEVEFVNRGVQAVILDAADFYQIRHELHELRKPELREPGNLARREMTDRSGRTWEYLNYSSPSGEAFWITVPDDVCPEGTANYTVHFDGSITVNQLREGEGDE